MNFELLVIEKGKEHRDSLDDGGPELRFNHPPVVVEPALDRIQLRQFIWIGLSRVEDRTRFERNASLQFAQFGCGRREITVFLGIMSESEADKVGGTFSVDLRHHRSVMASQNDFLVGSSITAEKAPARLTVPQGGSDPTNFLGG
ncbi:MAG: hypothetical protein ACYC93_03080 [Candidatus Acidiferrales bacterium]